MPGVVSSNQSGAYKHQGGITTAGRSTEQAVGARPMYSEILCFTLFKFRLPCVPAFSGVLCQLLFLLV